MKIQVKIIHCVQNKENKNYDHELREPSSFSIIKNHADGHREHDTQHQQKPDSEMQKRFNLNSCAKREHVKGTCDTQGLMGSVV